MGAVSRNAAGVLLAVHDEDLAGAEPPQFDRGGEAGRACSGDEHVDVHVGLSRPCGPGRSRAFAGCSAGPPPDGRAAAIIDATVAAQ
jgi:hypothetical protein